MRIFLRAYATQEAERYQQLAEYVRAAIAALRPSSSAMADGGHAAESHPRGICIFHRALILLYMATRLINATRCCF